MMIFSRLSAAVLGGLLSIPSLHAATAAACNGGDLAGTWSQHVSLFSESAPPTILWCKVTLSPGSGSDARKYAISGNCKNYSTTSGQPQDLLVGGTGLNLRETSNCKFEGSYLIGIPGVAFTVTILDARIEGGSSPKQRVTGISRIETSPTNFQPMRFRFQR
jgi:hypothetical protein